MKIILNSASLIKNFIKNHGVVDNKDEYQNYVNSIFREIIGDKALIELSKLNISMYETIFIGKKPLSTYCKKLNDIETSLKFLKYILKGKSVFITRLKTENDAFIFSPPEKIYFTVFSNNDKTLEKLNLKLNKSANSLTINKSHYRTISGYLESANINILRDLITSAKRDYDFIVKYNGEIFYKSIIYRGNNITKETAEDIFSANTKTIDLSDRDDRIAFLTLYGMSRNRFTFDDVYTVGGIFSPDENRKLDKAKMDVGFEVFELIINNDREKIKDEIRNIGSYLLQMKLIPVSSENYSLITNNFSKYNAFYYMGRVMADILLSDNYEFEKINIFSKRLLIYGVINDYFDFVLNNPNERIKYSKEYDNFRTLVNTISDKKLVNELDYTFQEVSPRQ